MRSAQSPFKPRGWSAGVEEEGDILIAHSEKGGRGRSERIRDEHNSFQKRGERMKAISSPSPIWPIACRGTTSPLLFSFSSLAWYVRYVLCLYCLAIEVEGFHEEKVLKIDCDRDFAFPPF